MNKKHYKDNLEYYVLENRLIDFRLKTSSFLDYKKIDSFHLSGVYIYENCLKSYLLENFNSIQQDDISNLFRGSIGIKNANESEVDFWLMDETKLKNIFGLYDKFNFENMKNYYPKERYIQFIKNLEKSKINQEISFEEFVSAQIENLKDFFDFVYSHYKLSRLIVCNAYEE